MHGNVYSRAFGGSCLEAPNEKSDLKGVEEFMKTAHVYLFCMKDRRLKQFLNRWRPHVVYCLDRRFRNILVSYLRAIDWDYSFFRQSLQIPNTGCNDMCWGRIERLKGDGRLLQSCGVMGNGVMKVITSHERAGMGCWAQCKMERRVDYVLLLYVDVCKYGWQ